MGMDAGVTFWYGLSYDDETNSEDDIQKQFYKAKYEFFKAAGEEPDNEDDEEDEERAFLYDEYDEHEFTIEGVTIQEIQVADDVYRGLGVVLLYHDWDYSAKTLEEINATVVAETLRVAPVVNTVFRGMGVDMKKVDIFMQTSYM